MNESKPLKSASAVRYKPGDYAPRIVAAGKGPVAEEILNIAKKNNIPIHVDPDTARLLSFIEIGKEIPQELYEVVAKVLVFVSAIDKQYMQK